MCLLRIEWLIDLLLMTQSSSGEDSKDMKENFEKRVTSHGEITFI